MSNVPKYQLIAASSVAIALSLTALTMLKSSGNKIHPLKKKPENVGRIFAGARDNNLGPEFDIVIVGGGMRHGGILALHATDTY